MASITIPWAVVVRRADPDRERALARETQYEFRNGRNFVADGRRSGVFKALAPSFITNPEITGPTKAGCVLRCVVNRDTILGAPEPSITRQWKADGVVMDGETNEALLTITADTGAAITCTVVLTNASGTATYTTDPVVVTAS